MLNGHRGLGGLCLLVALGLAAAGCAGTAAGVKPTAALPSPPDLSGYANLRLDVTKADGVQAGGAETERITKRIVEAIEKKQPGRFKGFNGDAGQPTLHATVELTRYDKGSAFARSMLAGLGRIHIDGKVSLKDPTKDASLGEFEVNKTFAWGGIYGAVTSIEDVEVGFAEGVADAILGKH